MLPLNLIANNDLRRQDRRNPVSVRSAYAPTFARGFGLAGLACTFAKASVSQDRVTGKETGEADRDHVFEQGDENIFDVQSAD